MAKKKSQKSNSEFVSRDAVKKLWNAIPVSEWFQLLQEIAPANRWEQKGHTQIVGCCPYHPDEKPSFSLSFHKCMGKCFGATCEKVVVDLVSLVAKLRNCSYTEALLFLNDRFNLGDKLRANTDELNKYNNIQELKKQAAIASNKVLLEVLRDNPEHLAYCRPALTYLIDVRKLPADTLSNLPVGVFGKPEHMKKYIPETLHPLYDEYFAKCKSIKHWGSLMFYYNDSPGSITRFKLRFRDGAVENPMPTQQDIDALDDHARSKLFTKEFEYVEDPYATGSLGVFGLFKYQRMVDKNDTNAYITEGEFDALSYMAAQDKHGSTNFMIISTGGKGSTDVGFLRDFGIRTCWMIQDHPVKNGDDWVLTFLGNPKNFTSNANKFPMDFKIFMWPVEIQGYDLDEAVRLNSFEMLVECLYRQRDGNFLNAVPWVINKCEGELDACKRDCEDQLAQIYDSDGPEKYAIQKANLLDQRKKAIKEVLVRWYHYLKDPIDRQTFLTKYSEEEGVDITECVSEQYSLDSFSGVVAHVTDGLKDLWVLTYYEKKAKYNANYAWSLSRNEIFELPHDPNSLLKTLAQYMGGDPIRWLRNLLGKNDILLEDSGGKSPLKREEIIQKNGKFIFNSVLNGLYHEAQNKDDLEVYNRGIHYSNLPAEQYEAGNVFFVNGKLVFKGTYSDDGVLRWEPHKSNVDKGIIFGDLTHATKWSCVESVGDLEAATQVDLQDVFHKLCKMLKGWRFKHQDVVEPYLAAYIMSLPIMSAVGDVNITYICGKKSSGKTSICDFLGGTARNRGPDRVPAVVESAIYVFDITPAGMYQTFTDSTLTMVMDEAEVSEKHQDKHDLMVKNVHRLIFELPYGGAHIDRGGATPDQRISYYLKMPLTMAAINIPTDPVLMSRVLVIETVKEPGRQNLRDYIYNLFTPLELAALRKAVTVGLLPHLPLIMKIREELRKNLINIGHDLVSVRSTRFLDIILTPLAVYKFLGFDVEKLYCDFLVSYKSWIESVHGQEEQNDLIDACLYRPRITIAYESLPHESVDARSLILEGKENQLNTIGCGVYLFKPEGSGKKAREIIVIVWSQAKHHILANSPYERMDIRSLRQSAGASPYVISEVSQELHQAIRNQLVLSDVSGPSDYTLIDAKYLYRGNINVASGADEGASSQQRGDVNKDMALEQAFSI